MRSRKLIAAAGLAVLVAVGAFVLWLSRDVTAGINPENFRRIAKRFDDGNWNGMPPMTVADVEAILSTPPGVYRTGRPLHPTGGFMPVGPIVPGAIHWRRDTYEIVVTTDATGRVESIGEDDFDKSPDSDDNFLSRAKRWWRRWFPE
jgi:hypothetical protein